MESMALLRGSEGRYPVYYRLDEAPPRNIPYFGLPKVCVGKAKRVLMTPGRLLKIYERVNAK